MGLMPRIARKRGADRILRLGLDGEHDAVLVRKRPAQDEEAGLDERVHEGRVHGPAGLLLQPPRRVPLRPRAEPNDEEHRHA
jgi:hypothetical protein